MELARSLLILASFLAVCLAQQCYDAGDKLINKRCFKLVNQKLSFNDARNWCRYSNPVTPSNLASVLDQTTSTWLASYARTSFNVNEGYFWIGLSRPTASSRYQWDDGQPFVYSNFEQQNGGNYVAESITNGRWSTYSADAKLNFVCSYDPANPPTFAPQTFAPTEGTTTEYATTTWEPASTISSAVPCDPLASSSFSTFLFGYSTNFDPSIVRQVKDAIVETLAAFPHRNRRFANVRFDSTDCETIHFHDSVANFSASVDANLPDKSVSVPGALESDYDNVLERFLTTKSSFLCGSTVLFLSKIPCQLENACFRSNQTLPLLTSNRVKFNFLQSNYPNTNYQLPTYNLPFFQSDVSYGISANAGQTSTNDDAMFVDLTRRLMNYSYRNDMIYAKSYYQSGSIARQQIEDLDVPWYPEGVVTVTLVVTNDSLKGRIGPFNMTLTLINQASKDRTELKYSSDSFLNTTDIIWDSFPLAPEMGYDVYLSYTAYSPSNIQIRMHSNQYDPTYPGPGI